MSGEGQKSGSDERKGSDERREYRFRSWEQLKDAAARVPKLREAARASFSTAQRMIMNLVRLHGRAKGALKADVEVKWSVDCVKR